METGLFLAFGGDRHAFGDQIVGDLGIIGFDGDVIAPVGPPIADFLAVQSDFADLST